MSSKFIIDSMLPKYHQQYPHQLLNPVITSTSSSDLSPSAAVNYSLTTNNNNSSSSSSSPPPSLVSSASRMYPYVAAHHHHQQQAVAAAAFAASTGSGSMVPGAFSTPGSAALAAAVDAVNADKSCRYTGNVPPPESMVNYSLHHQNGAASSSVSAASASMAAAAQFYHQAAAASVAADPLSSCTSQVASAATGQPMPDIPRYPWMSITGKCPLDYIYLTIHHVMFSSCLLLLSVFK